MVDRDGGYPLTLADYLGDGDPLRTQAKGEAQFPSAPDDGSGGRHLRQDSSTRDGRTVVLAFYLCGEAGFVGNAAGFGGRLAMEIRDDDFTAVDGQAHRGEGREQRHDEQQQCHPQKTEKIAHSESIAGTAKRTERARRSQRSSWHPWQFRRVLRG